MPDEADTLQRVKEVMVKALGLRVNPQDIPDDETIFGGGLGADSTAALEVVFAVEEAFGIEVEDEELRVDLFDSARALAEYVERKRIPCAPSPGPLVAIEFPDNPGMHVFAITLRRTEAR